MHDDLSQNFLENFQKKKSTETYSTETREYAWQLFTSEGLPTSRDERYRYIAPHLFRATNDEVGSNDVNEKFFSEKFFRKVDAFHLVIVDGWLSMGRSMISGYDDFFSIKKDKEAFECCRDFDFFEKKNDAFAALNRALYSQDIYLEVRSGLVLPKPIVIHLLSESACPPAINHPLLHVEALERSKAEVVILNECWGRHGAGFLNSQILINLRQGAELNFYNLNFSKNENLTCISNETCVQESESCLGYYSFCCGEGVVRNNLRVHLNEKNAQANLFGLVKAQRNSCMDNHTTVFHNAPDTRSSEMYRHIGEDSGTIVFNGEIMVDRVAQRTRAFQSNDSLLVSNEATVHSKPQLEIFADDVKCSHGATIGKVDAEMLLYLRCRGIPEKEARDLLMAAFVEAILEKVDNPMLKAALESAML